jgi:hypothetical protein
MAGFSNMDDENSLIAWWVLTYIWRQITKPPPYTYKNLP